MAAIVPMRWSDVDVDDHTGIVVDAPPSTSAALVSEAQLQSGMFCFVATWSESQPQWQPQWQPQPQRQPVPCFFRETPDGVELVLDCCGSCFPITESSLLKRSLKQRRLTKEATKALRKERFDAVKAALEECRHSCLVEIIEQAFSEEWLSRFWEDESGNYFVQHLLSVAAAEQVEHLIHYLRNNIDTMLVKRTAFAGRYIERLSERSDFLDLLGSTSCSLKILVDQIAIRAALWATHRDGNYALGALLERAPMWFVYKAHHELRVANNAKGNSSLHASFRIGLEKAESRLRAEAHAALNFKAAAMHRTQRRSQSTSALRM